MSKAVRDSFFLVLQSIPHFKRERNLHPSEDINFCHVFEAILSQENRNKVVAGLKYRNKLSLFPINFMGR
jgi:hypothetical protein